ncbi:5775_t:CDS:2, partial [Ambispora gerdemannii]
WLLKIKKTSIQNSEVLSDGTLRINSKGDYHGNVGITCTVVALPYKTYSRYEEDKFTENKGHESYSAYKSALQDIENTIKNGNIDLTTLADSGLFLNESYMNGMPRDCLACGNIDPNETPVAKYYQTHLKKCIWRTDRINEFKDKQIALIERIITKFNDYKKEAIQEVIQEAQEKGVSETELNTTQIDIENLVAAKKKSGEERQQAENETKANAKKEEE